MRQLLDGLPQELALACVVTAILGLVSLVTKRAWSGLSKRSRRRRNARAAADLNQNEFALGGVRSTVWLPDFQPAGYQRDSIRCELVAPRAHPGAEDAEFEQARARWESEVQSGAIFNGQVIALESFRVLRTPDNEQPGLHLKLRTTDYVHQRATAETYRALEPQRRDAEASEARERPGHAGRYSSTFGVPVAVITSDDQLVWLRRSNSSAVNAGRLTCTTAEGMNRDDFRSGIPDPYLCAARGLHEELGIRLAPEELGAIKFVALSLDLDWWEWTLVGVLRLGDLREHDLDAMTLRQYYASARAKDKWETGELLCCPFDPNDVATFIEANPVTNYGAVTASLALLADPSIRRAQVAQAFARVQCDIGDRFPSPSGSPRQR